MCSEDLKDKSQQAKEKIIWLNWSLGENVVANYLWC